MSTIDGQFHEEQSSISDSIPDQYVELQQINVLVVVVVCSFIVQIFFDFSKKRIYKFQISWLILMI